MATVLEVRDRTRAIRVANDTSFGLGAAVFTADVEEGERIAREELNAGCCFVNTFVRSDPRLPFGGILDSGYGRELGQHGIREFMNAKNRVCGLGITPSLSIGALSRNVGLCGAGRDSANQQVSHVGHRVGEEAGEAEPEGMVDGHDAVRPRYHQNQARHERRPAPRSTEGQTGHHAANQRHDGEETQEKQQGGEGERNPPAARTFRTPGNR